MKTEMSSLDCYAVVKEMKGLAGARLNKVYQIAPQELKLTLNVPGQGKKDLVIEAGKRVHTTMYPKPSPKAPTTFAMTLRKHIGNAVFHDIAQHAFDRIIELTFQGPAGEFRLIAELFGGGNVVLADSEGIVRAVMRPQRYKDRDILGRRPYEYPPQRINPLELDAARLGEHFADSNKDLVRFLAMEMGLGGQLAEEVCARAGLEKGEKELDESGVETLHEALSGLFNEVGKVKTRIVFEDEKPVDLLPIEVEAYLNLEAKEFETFMEAADEYFTQFEIKRVDNIREDMFQNEIGALRARLKDQTRVLKKHIGTEKEAKVKGDLIYSHFGLVEEILATLLEARKEHDWKDIQAIIDAGKDKSEAAKVVKQLLPKEGGVVLEMDSTNVRLDLRKNASQNADDYYAKGKKARRKIPMALEATRETVGKIRKLKERGKEAMKVAEQRPEERKVVKRAWYEKFRWFTSSDGLLVLGGRDASSNEVLVKKHMEKDDIFVHAEIHGAPGVVIKTEGKEVPETTIQEAFDFAASYSSAWKHSVFGLDVYWVNPDQVSKTTEHGEYVARGAFIIRGKRNFGKGVVELAVGYKIEEDGAKAIGGPPGPIEMVYPKAVRITPGVRKSQDIAKEIKGRWLEGAAEKEKPLIQDIPLEDIQAFLPPGGSDIKG